MDQANGSVLKRTRCDRRK